MQKLKIMFSNQLLSRRTLITMLLFSGTEVNSTENLHALSDCEAVSSSAIWIECTNYSPEEL